MRSKLLVLFLLPALPVCAQTVQWDNVFGFAAYDQRTWDTGGRALAVKPDGKIVIGGSESGSGNTRAMVVQLLPDNGDFDPSFDEDGVVFVNFCISTDRVSDIAVQPDGKILVAGSEDFDDPDHDDQAMILRLLEDGTVDSTWADNGMRFFHFVNANTSLQAIALQEDGRVLVAGTFNLLGEQDAFVRRYLPDGLLDSTFNGTGTRLIQGPLVENLYDLVVQPDGKILLGGREYPHQVAYRFLPDGTPDSGFGVDGRLADLPDEDTWANWPTRMIQDELGRVIFYGPANTWDSQIYFKVIAYLPDGERDGSFGVNGEVGHPVVQGTNHSYGRAAALANGKTVFSFNDGVAPGFDVLCLNADGSGDEAFGPGGRGAVPIPGGYSHSSAGDIVRDLNDGIVVLNGISATPPTQYGPMCVRYHLPDQPNGLPQANTTSSGAAFPVPNGGRDVSMRCAHALAAAPVVRVVDMNGRAVNVSPSFSGSIIRLNGSAALPAGVYTLSVLSAGQHEVHRMVIE